MLGLSYVDGSLEYQHRSLLWTPEAPQSLDGCWTRPNVLELGHRHPFSLLSEDSPDWSQHMVQQLREPGNSH